MWAVIVGISLVALLLFDIFQAAVVPRFTPAPIRLAPLLIGRIMWPVCRAFALRIPNVAVADFMLGSFASLGFVTLFAIWLGALMCAFGLIVYGIGDHFTHGIHSVDTAIFVAGTAVLTQSFPDIIAITPLSRAVLLFGAVTGVSVIAIGVAFLFSMQQSVHQREASVNKFIERIGEDASAVGLLCLYSKLGISAQLPEQIQAWESWIAEIFDTHRAYPLLCYFRSSHTTLSWVTMVGVLMDLSVLLTTTIDDARFGEANFLYKLGAKLMAFLKDYFKLKPIDSDLSRSDFALAYRLLKESGYKMYEEESAYEKFTLARHHYAGVGNALAEFFACKAAGWTSARTAFNMIKASREQESSFSRF